MRKILPITYLVTILLLASMMNASTVTANHYDNKATKLLSATELSKPVTLSVNNMNTVALAPPSMIQFITTKAIGSTITLRINAELANRPDVWIDLNGNGQRDVNEDVTNFSGDEDYIIDSQTITIYGLVNFLICKNNEITNLDIRYTNELKYLDCSFNQITSLNSGINNNVLETLICTQNDLASLDLSNLHALIKFHCKVNDLTSLDFTQNPELYDIDCFSNDLTNIDVTQNPKLTKFGCAGNDLTSLDVTQNPDLEVLNCLVNDLTSLDVTQNPKLKELNCSYNQLVSLDITQNTLLERLYCSYNQLVSLDITQNTLLERLYCYNNQLTSLDLSNNTVLKRLEGYSNQLTSLDISNNIELKRLVCSSNQLTSLDISNNIKLKELFCGNNQLTSLEVGNNNTLLEKLYCQNNLFSTPVVTNLFCSLPDKSSGSSAKMRLLGTPPNSDPQYAAVIASNASIATNKNWQVLDGSNNPITTSGTDDCTMTTTTQISETVCDDNLPYSFGTQQLSETGTYSEVFTTSTGTEVVTLHLKVVEKQEDQSITICESELPYHFGEYVFSEVKDTTYKFLDKYCGNIYHLHLKVIPLQKTTIEKSICTSELPYSFSSQSLTDTGIYSETFSTVEGNCDSLVTLKLTVLEPVTKNISQSICASELPYSFGSEMISQAGVYSHTMQAQNGCDSITTLNLVVWENPQQPVIEVKGDTLTAPFANQYNWYLDDELMTMHDKQQIIIDKSASYSLQVINQKGCKSPISEKIDVIYSSIKDDLLQISVYPNPVYQQLTITGLPTTSTTQIKLYNVAGQMILNRNSNSSIEKIDMRNMVSGIYMLKIADDKFSKNLKIIKK